MTALFERPTERHECEICRVADAEWEYVGSAFRYRWICSLHYRQLSTSADRDDAHWLHIGGRYV